MAADHSKSGHDVRFSNGPKLDRFGMNKIFFMTIICKTVYASNRTQMSGFRSVRYSNGRDWHKIEFEYRPRFGIRMLTVYKSLLVTHIQKVTKLTLFFVTLQMYIKSNNIIQICIPMKKLTKG